MGRISEPTWLEDTPTRCRVFFFHAGPMENHTHDLGFFVSPGNSWWIPTLKVSEGTRPLSAGGDFVTIMAGTAMQHIVQPPEHGDDWPFGNPAVFGGPGASGSGGPGMNAAAFPEGGAMANSVDVVHAEGHVDRYRLMITANVDGPRIKAYRISLLAEHLALDVDELEPPGKGGQREQSKPEPREQRGPG